MDDGAIFQFDRDCFIGAFHKKSRASKKSTINKLCFAGTVRKTAGWGCLSMEWSQQWMRKDIDIPDELHFGAGWRSSAPQTDRYVAVYRKGDRSGATLQY